MGLNIPHTIKWHKMNFVGWTKKKKNSIFTYYGPLYARPNYILKLAYQRTPIIKLSMKSNESLVYLIIAPFPCSQGNNSKYKQTTEWQKNNN